MSDPKHVQHVIPAKKPAGALNSAAAPQKPPPNVAAPVKPVAPDAPAPAAPSRKPEIGGPKGPEPTRFGDWESNGRCVDF
ncbi:MAG TPA: DUF1674 domain-containing protein [Alphaproteobacteria bacterium]|nr:DUF1674 domain-containing protein [Alphaproteobacteria bacterium]